MPNVKIYLDQGHFEPAFGPLSRALPDLCEMLCEGLSVDRTACQMALLGVAAPDGQPPVNVELHLLPRPERTREFLTEFGGRLRDRVGEITGLATAIRIGQLDAGTYVALK